MASEESNLHVITRKTCIRKKGEGRKEKGGENANSSLVANFPRGGKTHAAFLHCAHGVERVEAEDETRIVCDYYN